MKRKPDKRRHSYLAAINNAIILPDTDSPLAYCLPKELWLTILVNYGLSATDLANLELACKWLNVCWEGYSIIEEAARLVIKRHKRTRFGELTNRLKASTWTERLYILEKMEANMCTLAAGSYQNIAIVNDRLLTWGAGKFGQLGNGMRQDYPDPKDISQSLNTPSTVVQVSAGCGHSGILMKNGEVFSCGDNRYGQLGQTDFQGQQCLVPTHVSDGLNSVHVLQIACGSSHTLFLSDMGRVYSVGQGDSGQLGLGPRTKSSFLPKCLPLEYETFNFIFIAAGIAHNVLLTECGKAFTCGLGSVGQLGHGGTKNLSTPAQVTAHIYHKKIVYASASVCHTVLVDSTGQVYTCGKGIGILGHGDSNIRTVPKLVDRLVGTHIIQATAGVGRTVFISKDGRGFWCGQGMGEHTNELLPVLMDLPEPLVSAAIGNSHIVLKMRSGRLMSMGNNGRYQTGHRTVRYEPVPKYTYIPNT